MYSRNDAMGVVLRENAKVGIRFERMLPHRLEKVWRALTESEELRHWLPCDIVGERSEGAPIELPFWPSFVDKYGIETPVVQGRILAWDPPVLFEWMWDVDLLRWELAARGDGTLLTFTTWLGEESPRAGTAAGYHVCLDRLAELLDTNASSTIVDAEVKELESDYEAIVERALAES